MALVIFMKTLMGRIIDREHRVTNVRMNERTHKGKWKFSLLRAAQQNKNRRQFWVRENCNPFRTNICIYGFRWKDVRRLVKSSVCFCVFALNFIPTLSKTTHQLTNFIYKESLM